MKQTVASRFEAARESIRSLLREHSAVLAYLFGSAARQEERADSDLDVAVFLDRAVPRDDYGEVRLRLTTELIGLTHTNDVDVVLLNEAPPLLAFEIVSKGKQFFGSDRDRVRFETAAIKRYIDTRPLREEAAKRLRARVQEASRAQRTGEGQW